LVQHALREAARRRHGAVLLVGDASYYERFGFSSEKTGALWLPGPFERHRLLANELTPGALDGARGLISAGGPPAPKPDLASLVADLVRTETQSASRAA
jgi:predicted N-acetyltransferase YhbS